MPVAPAALAAGGRLRALQARLATGRPLPRFIKVDMDNGGVEVLGVPVGGDVGVYEVGVYERGGDCVGRVVVEVVERKAV